MRSVTSFRQAIVCWIVVVMTASCSACTRADHHGRSARQPSGASGVVTTLPVPSTIADRDCPTEAELARRSTLRPRVVTVTEPRQPISGELLEPVPEGLVAKISSDQAWASARGNLPLDPGPDPTIALAMHSSTATARHLAWVIVSRRITPSSSFGGPAPMPGVTRPPLPKCVDEMLVEPVDALNGISMGAGEGGPYESPPCPTPTPDRAGQSPALRSLSTPEDPVNGERLDLPPANARPIVSSDVAIAAARRDFKASSTKVPTIALAQFSDEHYPPPGRLAWAVVFEETVVAPAEAPCTLGTVLVPVDAANGQVLTVAHPGMAVIG